MVQRYFTVCGGGLGAATPPPDPHPWGGLEGPSAPPNLPNCQVDQVRIEPCLKSGTAKPVRLSCPRRAKPRMKIEGRRFSVLGSIFTLSRRRADAHQRSDAWPPT